MDRQLIKNILILKSRFYSVSDRFNQEDLQGYYCSVKINYNNLLICGFRLRLSSVYFAASVDLEFFELGYHELYLTMISSQRLKRVNC